MEGEQKQGLLLTCTSTYRICRALAHAFVLVSIALMHLALRIREVCSDASSCLSSG